MRDGQGQGDVARDIQRQDLERRSAGDDAVTDHNQSVLDAVEAALRVAQDDIERLKKELTDRRHEFETVQSTLWQREEEIAQTRASLDLERHNATRADMRRSTADGELEAIEKKLKVANEWVFRLAGERKAAEDRAARAEARLAAAEKTLAFLSARLAGVKEDQDRRSREKADLLREKEELAKMAESLRSDGEEAAQRLIQSQSEIVALSRLLQQRESELAAGQSASGQTQAQSAEARMLSTMLQNSQAEADRSARRSEWLQKVSAVITGYPSWWAFVPKRWRLRWEQGRLQRKGLFDADSYLARYPDVSASGMDPLRHYIIHGINENRSF